MKKMAAAVIFCMLLFIGGSAYANGYIIKLSDNAPMLLMNTDESVSPLGHGGDYFYADNFQSLIPYLGCAENICEDFTLELFDYPETTNDTYFSEQWNHPAMKTEAARRAGLDGSGVKIGIVDSGININHEDFNTENIVYALNTLTGEESLEAVNDSYGHGSFVAGTIAARVNNGLGIAGIADGAQLAIFLVTDGKELFASDLIEALNAAVEINCDVINMSLGARKEALTEEQFDMLSSVINKAYENNVIVVSAVGNDAVKYNFTHYPAAFESVIGVASVDRQLERSYFSNYNESVFIAAPGSSIYGISIPDSSSYTRLQGTSFSTPEVVAAAAIAKQLWTDMTPDDFQQLLIDTADDLGDEGYDIYYGYGLLNFENIVNTLLPEPTIKPLAEYEDKLTIRQTVSEGKAELTLTANGEYDLADMKAILCIYKDGAPVSAKIYLPEEQDGNFIITADVPAEGEYKFMLWDKDLTPVILPVCEFN